MFYIYATYFCCLYTLLVAYQCSFTYSHNGVYEYILIINGYTLQRFKRDTLGVCNYDTCRVQIYVQQVRYNHFVYISARLAIYEYMRCPKRKQSAMFALGFSHASTQIYHSHNIMYLLCRWSVRTKTHSKLRQCIRTNERTSKKFWSRSRKHSNDINMCEYCGAKRPVDINGFPFNIWGISRVKVEMQIFAWRHLLRKISHAL